MEDPQCKRVFLFSSAKTQLASKQMLVRWYRDAEHDGSGHELLSGCLVYSVQLGEEASRCRVDE